MDPAETLRDMTDVGWRFADGLPRKLIDPRTGDSLVPAEAIARYHESRNLMARVLEVAGQQTTGLYAAWLSGVLEDLRRRGWTIEPPADKRAEREP